LQIGFRLPTKGVIHLYWCRLGWR